MERYGGRTVGYWERLLAWPRPSVSRFALRALSHLGESGAKALQRSAPPWPEAAWALARTGHGESCPLARLMGRRHERPQPMRRLREARRLLPAFYWAGQLGGRDITPLVDLLRHTGNPAVLAASAWALGRLGRAVLPECLDACRQAALPTRRRFCRVFWYLGPEAREAADLLASWLPEGEAEASLLAMEEAGSRAMIRGFRPDQDLLPVWLDQAAVDELAGLAFGETLRLPAIRALGGFGPAGEAAVRVLKVLANDSEPLVRRTALESLVASGQSEAVLRLLQESPGTSLLRALPQEVWLEHLYGQDEDAQLQALWRCQPLEVPSSHWERLHELRCQGSPSVQLAAVRLLLAIPLARGPWSDELLTHPSAEVSRQAVAATSNLPALEDALLDLDSGVRREAARHLLERDRYAFARFILSQDVDIREEAWQAARHDPFRQDVARRLFLAGEVNPSLLRLLGERGNLGALVGQALQHCEPRHRQWLARELADTGEIGVCRDLLRSRRPGLRRAGAAALRLMVAARRAEPVNLPGLLEGEPSGSVRILLLETMRLHDAWRLETYRRKIGLRRQDYPDGWKDKSLAVRLLVREALLEEKYLPPDMEACLAGGWHHSREALDVYLHLAGREAFLRMARSSLERLSADERALMARRLGFLEALPVLEHFRRENPCEGHRLLRLALRESTHALDLLAHTGEVNAFHDIALQALREGSPFPEKLLELVKDQLGHRSPRRRRNARELLAAIKQEA